MKKLLSADELKAIGYDVNPHYAEDKQSVYIKDGYETGMRIVFDTSDYIMKAHPKNVVELELYQKQSLPSIKFLSLDELILLGKMAEEIKESKK